MTRPYEQHDFRFPAPAPGSSVPARREWNAAAELFPRDFTGFVLPQNCDQLVRRTTAHTFHNYADFQRFIQPAVDAVPAPKPKSPTAARLMGASGLLSFLTFLVLPSALFINTVSGGAIFGALAASFLFFCAFLFFLFQYLTFRTHENNAPSALERFAASIGGPPETVLPVFIVDRTTLTAEQNEVLDQCIGLYNYCAANDLGLSPEHWRSLTAAALERTHQARVTGDASLLADVHAHIRRIHTL